MPDFVDTTGSNGGSPEIAQKNMANSVLSGEFGFKRVFFPVRCFHLFTRRILSFVTMSEKQQRLVYAIIEFINQSIKDGTVKADDQDSLEVASSFIFIFTLLFSVLCVSEQFNASVKRLG